MKFVPRLGTHAVPCLRQTRVHGLRVVVTAAVLALALVPVETPLRRLDCGRTAVSAARKWIYCAEVLNVTVRVFDPAAAALMFDA